PFLSSFFPPRPSDSTLFPYTTLFRSLSGCGLTWLVLGDAGTLPQGSGGILGMATGDGLGRIINPLGAAWLLFTIFIITLSTGLRSEEHTSELQSRFDLVCRLLLEKKK